MRRDELFERQSGNHATGSYYGRGRRGRGDRSFTDWPQGRRGRGRFYVPAQRYPEDEEIQNASRTISTVSSVSSEGRNAQASKTDTSTRMEDIVTLLQNNKYECMICFVTIKKTAPIFTCTCCHRLFHLTCLQKWSNGSAFRCPNCQVEHKQAPAYVCFCGKTRNPEFDNYSIPHSCSQLCGKRRGTHCPHPCALQCHPGMCLPCTQTRVIKCHCGKEESSVSCADSVSSFQCDSVCDKLLACGKHKCDLKCHDGQCAPCSHTIEVKCHCACNQKHFPCGTEPETYSCEAICGKGLECGSHSCERRCHSDPCGICPLDPRVCKTCPCGKRSLSTFYGNSRLQCTDLLPTCGQVCGKKLLCGLHSCAAKCHSGSCEECRTVVTVYCRCKQSHQRLPCFIHNALKEEYKRLGETEPVTLVEGNAEYTYPILCNRNCGCHLSCGRHKCERTCCEYRQGGGEGVHTCRRVCGRKLPCGHHCEDTCHKGGCLPCPYIVTDELPCTCGRTILHPPQPCGTKPPNCSHPCTKTLGCGHESVSHPCHTGECPPCVVKVTRACVGGHVDIPNVPCHLKVKSCGQPCLKLLECGHECKKTCHVGDCDTGPCQQKCGKPLPCNHPCDAKCHREKPCPACTAKIEITCECGRRKEKITCRQYDQLFKAKSSSKKGTLSLHDLPHLDCTKECEGELRFRGLAQALGIKDDAPEKENCLWPSFLVTQGRKAPAEVLQYEAALRDFINGTKPFHLFPMVMREKRAFLHHFVAHYIVNSESLDKNPKKDVIIHKTAGSRIPHPLLSEAIKNTSYDSSSVGRERMQKQPNACILFDSLPSTVKEPELSVYLTRFAGKFAFVWLSDNVALACFPNSEMASEAMSGAIKSGCSQTIKSYHSTLYPQLNMHQQIGSSSVVPRPRPKIQEKQVVERCAEDFINPKKTAKVKPVAQTFLQCSNSYSGLTSEEWPSLR